MGRPKTREMTPYQRNFEPIILKELALACDISQGELAQATGLSRPTINLAVNKGHLPSTIPDFKARIEGFIEGNSQAMLWLLERQLTAKDIWFPLGKDLRNVAPAGMVQRNIDRKNKLHGLELGNPETITVNWEVEMLHPEVMKHFKLFRHPFLNDIKSEKDIYLSDEHRYIEAAMMDAAIHTGFIAVIGEVGSGKSTIRKKVVENLKRDGSVTVIYPRSHKINVGDKYQSRINAVNLCDAIILDISGEKPKLKTEHKVRQLEQLLISRSNQGYKHVLIIEEAHNLTCVALKYLKQFYELEDGFKKLLGIILVGQTELKEMLDETKHLDMREVIRRVQIAEIHGLNDNLRGYLEFKFKRIGGKVESIFAEDVYEALSRRLTVEDQKKRKISHTYPNLVNTYVVRAMNLAFEMGETMVTAEVIGAI